MRLSGQDSRRGTFNQRHAVLIDVETEEEFLPLAQLATPRSKVFFEVYDSMLSEAAVLGFEYGYSRDYPEALALWEAQFGDFANGAQIIIDQFVTAGEDKWGLLSGLVLLLPHGYEGQGPEHSSARFERFLTLAAEHNIQVCQPSTAAQYFHLLRRQALRRWRKPLVVLTPKSMLRHKASASELAELTLTGSPPHTPNPSPTLKGGEGRPHPPSRGVPAGGGGRVDRGRARRRGCSCAPARSGTSWRRSGRSGRTGRRRSSSSTSSTRSRRRSWRRRWSGTRRRGRWCGCRRSRRTWGRSTSCCRGSSGWWAGERQVRSVKRSASASPATGSAKAHGIEQANLIRLAFTTFETGR